MKTPLITLAHRVVLSLLAILLLSLLSIGCNTAHGFGKDIEKAGEKIQDGTK